MAVGLLAIDRLRLDEAFSQGTYRPFDECWSVRMDSKIMVVDDENDKCSRYSDNKDKLQKALLIVNGNHHQIVLLSIDNKLIKNHKGGIADCAVFDENQFRIVEFKTNAYGHSDESIRDTFDKAVSQLEETIQVFRRTLQIVDIQFEEAVELRCHIVVSHSFPKCKAAKQEYQMSFAQDNGIELSFAEKTQW